MITRNAVEKADNIQRMKVVKSEARKAEVSVCKE